MTKKSLMMTFVIIIFLIGNNTLSTSVNIIKTMKIPSINEYIPKEAWNKTFGGTNLDWGWSVQETTDGGFIIAGETVSFGAGGYDAWLIKTDSNGNETWNKTFGGLAKDGVRSVQQTNDSGYIIVGYADSYGYPGHDVWLIKTDDGGNEEWSSIFGGLASDAALSVWQTTDEGYVAVGYVDSFGAGDHDVWLIKTNKYGNEEWNKTYGTAKWDVSNSVQQTSDDGYIIIGATESYGSGNDDVWLIKTDMYGNEEWNKTYGGTLNDWGSAVVMTDDGGYLITGDTRSYGPGGYDVWLIKTDMYGNEEWNRTYGDSLSTDTGYSLKKTSDGGYIVTGTKTSFDTELTDVWLIKTDVNGYMQWNLTLDGGEDDWSYSVDETIDGGYIITGLTNSYGNGSYDLWLIKVELVLYENQPPNIPSNPAPADGEIDVIIDVDISWTGGDPDGDEVTYDVYFGTTSPPPKVKSNQSDETYDPGILEFQTTYYWQIVAWDSEGATSSGPIWSFTTEENLPPYTPSNPDPRDEATDVTIYKILSWTGGDPNIGDSVTYDVYFGNSSPPPLVAEDINQEYLDPGILELDTTYYWQIVAEDSPGLTTSSPIWSFTTEEEPNESPTAPDIDGPSKGSAGVDLCWAFHSYDPNEDQIKYNIDWGDETSSETDYSPDCTPVKVCHTYEEDGEYIITATAEDEKGLVSDESTVTVTIPRTRTASYLLFYWFLECFPLLEKLLSLIIAG